MQVQNAGYYGCVGFYEENDWGTSRFFLFLCKFYIKRTEKDMEDTYAGIVEAILDFFSHWSVYFWRRLCNDSHYST